MTPLTLVRRSLAYHWRTNVAVVLGVTAAVSVLAGALVVGESVRGSLREIATGRLGRTDSVVTAMGYFRDALAEELAGAPQVSGAAPLIVANGFITHESSGLRASNVLVYGVDERFWRFHGVDPTEGVQISQALADEVGGAEGDVLLTRLQRPSEVPIESLFGRRDEVGRTLRLIVSGILPRDRLGEFALSPQQSHVRAVFAPLRRIQRDLGVENQVNAVLIAGDPDERVFRSAVQLEDLGVSVVPLEELGAVAVESAAGIVNEALERAATGAAARLGLTPTPVFTYLANTIRAGEREIPYSLVTATDLSALPPTERQSLNHPPGTPNPDTILVNDWAARELNAAPGDRIDVEYYLWDPLTGLTTRSASFMLAGVVPIEGLAADRRLAPEYPGITAAGSLAEWDPPFPIDLSRVRPEDERYWDEHRATPKAFISYERGRDLWASRYGAMTAVRVAVAAGADVAAAAAALRLELHGALAPAALGVRMYPARRMALEGATGATDFGEYFTYFSFFLMVSALLLAVLFFRLGIEQRLRQLGTLRASGYPVRTIRKLLLTEALALALIGAVLGMAGAVLYAAVIVHGLRTWWVGAVGTTLLEVHITAGALLTGAAGGIIAAALCVVVSLRAIARVSPRALLAAQTPDSGTPADARHARRNRRLAALFFVAAASLLTIGFLNPAAQAVGFFGGGAALLIALLMLLAAWLRSRDARPIAGRGVWAVSRLGFRSAAFRPGRSVLSAALIASAAFIIVSVDAFRRDLSGLTTDPRSGTGGYVLLAQSELPFVQNPNDPAGRDALLIQARELERTRFTRFRMRPGEDASCLNLYRPTNPTIIAPEPGFIESARFTFASSVAESDEERTNPWLLLRRRFDDGAVPAIADATSLQYVLHASLGDTFSIDTGADRPVVLRFVAALRDSVLQGQLVIAEEQFVRHFPNQQGYRFFLIDDPSVHSVEEASALAGIVERELQPFGVDAVVTSERLAEFHRVENTYLSTFQALGGLGLLLGTIGLATVMFRNVLERRRELALLRAVGYDARTVSTMVLAESAFLLGAGLTAGAGCAMIAIGPAWFERGGTRPGSGLVALLVTVIVAGVLSSLVATRAAVAGNMLAALRSE